MKLRALPFLSLSVLLLAACAGSSSTAPSDVEVTEGEDAVTTTSDLNTKDSKLVLTLLDDVCGDTWCEGDYDWQFKKISCSYAKKSCSVTMLVVDAYSETSPKPVFWRTCKVGGVSGFADLVDTAPNGYQSLDDGFYDRMTTCIGRIETHLR